VWASGARNFHFSIFNPQSSHHAGALLVGMAGHDRRDGSGERATLKIEN
jgi:hypothetical protein